MRIVIVGATMLGVLTARKLLDEERNVVIVEADRAALDEISEELDCGFIHGDGTRPHILRQTDPQEEDSLLALLHDDQDNILAALVGRSLGFGRVVPRLQDPDYVPICEELGLEERVVPDETTSQRLVEITNDRKKRD